MKPTQISNQHLSNPRDAHSLLIQMVNRTKLNLVQMGAVLKYLKLNENFKDTTGGVDNWDDYVKQPEIGLSPGEANRMIQVYEIFCEQLGYPMERIGNVPVKNLHYLLPIAKESEKQRVDELLLDAEHLTQKDFRDKVFEDKVKGERTYEYFIMEKCIETGNMKKIFDVPEEEIKKLITIYTTEKYF